ncbi:MAG: zinc ribbon domain-containing protein [Treponema sp.]|nr:zinc ribbon domain-containing protein [Treponema sp.]
MMDFFTSQSAQTPQSENAMQKEEAASTNGQKITRFCTNCGSPLEADDLFCSECGCKIELEEEAVVIEEDETETSVQEEQTSVTISSDRMASILQTNRIKAGEATDELKKPALPSVAGKSETKEMCAWQTAEKKSTIVGYYMRSDEIMTQYLIIESVRGNTVTASVRTTFVNGGYATESYEGTLFDDKLRLRMVNADLHPPPDETHVFFGKIQTVHHSIRRSEHFEGIANGDTISGAFSGEWGSVRGV